MKEDVEPGSAALTEGLRVLDLSHGTTGPRLTGFLADYGADVVWIERPGGDPLRRRQPAAASVFNRGKRSIEADLTAAAGRDRVMGLIRGADVLVESWRPGTAARLGVGWEHVHSVNPSLVYCSISGFGQVGRHRDIPGYESIVHAVVGTMAEQSGHREGPIYQGLPFASIGAAYLGLIGILAALLRREDDGWGRRVETSLLDGALGYHSMLWGENDTNRDGGLQVPPAGPRMTASRRRLITRSFRCADGTYLGIHTGALGAFDRLMAVLGLDARIPRSDGGMEIGAFLTTEQADYLEANIHRIFASRDRAYWVDRLTEADVCAIEHLHPGEVFERPQARFNEMVAVVHDPLLGELEQVGPPVRWRDRPVAAPSQAPRTGEHDDMPPWPALPPRARTPQPDPRPLLAGLRVLDFGAFYAGPYSSRLLADLGAEVIKLEPTRGDPLRGLDQPFFSAQAGKRSLAMDLKHPGAGAIIERLVEWADVIHHNLRPGAAERLAVDGSSVRSRDPSIVYLYAPGWGREGPERLRQSFAPMMSGYVGVTFEVAGRFNEPMPPVGNEDPGNGLVGAVAILMGLLRRRRTGDGCELENPQLNASMSHMAHVVRLADGRVLGSGSLDPLQLGVSATDRLYRTADGWLCLAVREDAEVAALGNVIGVELADDERFRTEMARADHDDQLVLLLEQAIASRPTCELLAELRAAGLAAVEPSGANRHRILTDPEFRENRRVAEVRHQEKGAVREIDQLIRVSDAEVAPHRPAPVLGGDSDEVLHDLGFSEDWIATARSTGLIA